LRLGIPLQKIGNTEKGLTLSDPENFREMAVRFQRRKSARPDAPPRLYETVAHRLVEDIRAGKYGVGDRLPAERDLAAAFKVSRPAVREALLALEVFGVIEVRIGSGAYVIAMPADFSQADFAVTAFELMEARLLIESEAAALAAVHITAPEIAALDECVERIAAANHSNEPGEGSEGSEGWDEAFHRLIAKAARNKAMELSVGNLWDLRRVSPACALLHDKARTANVQPVVDEHRAIVDALRAGDAAGARAAMRAHLSEVIDHLLFAIEEQAVEDARASVEDTRRRYARADLA